MDVKDCKRIAHDANIRFEDCIDIFYNKYSEFDKYESNMKAARQLKLFCPLGEHVKKAGPGFFDFCSNKLKQMRDYVMGNQ